MCFYLYVCHPYEILVGEKVCVCVGERDCVCVWVGVGVFVSEA